LGNGRNGTEEEGEEREKCREGKEKVGTGGKGEYRKNNATHLALWGTGAMPRAIHF